jgi:hypothetical protein
MNEGEKRREAKREEKPKQSTNIANNDFIIIIIIILWRNFPTWPKIFPENEKKNNTNFLFFLGIYFLYFSK